MAKQFLTPIDLAKNELQNAAIQNLGSAPSSPVKGQLYFNSTGGDNTLYWWDGTVWVPAKATASVALATSTSPLDPSTPASGGSASTASKGDHVHDIPDWGTITAQTAFGAVSSNGSGTLFARNDHVHGTPVHDASAHSLIPISALAVPTIDVSWNSKKITSLADPVATTDAANKQYVDNLAAGLSWKDAVRAASTVNFALSGPQTVDGVAVIANDRVLVKNQASPAANGIYDVKAGAWTRSSDCDTAADILNFTCFVSEGGQADTAWVCTANAPITVDTTALPVVQFGAGTAYIGGAGLVLNTSTFDIVAADGSIVVNADSIQVGYAGTGTTFGSAATAARSDHNHNGTYARRFAMDVGGATSVAVAHNFGTKDVVVNVFRNTTPWDTVECDVERTDTNTVTLRFATAPGAAAHRAVVMAV